ncbi:hypothetical protein P7L79_12700 [Tistrella mobilis]|uniref:hypothetical protein n=1 Tax=Tistrella mobilis TaxID=171437 RepID=UPI003556CA84
MTDYPINISPVWMPALMQGIKTQHRLPIPLIHPEGRTRASRATLIVADVRAWVRIHGKSGPASWAANPWVVALTFKVEPHNIDKMVTP